MGVSEESQVDKQSEIQERQDQIRHIVLIMDDMVKYNRISELGDLVKYHSKLMSYYGFDVKTGKWDTRLFPITLRSRRSSKV